MSPSKIHLYRDDLFLDHDPGPGHPENAARLSAVYTDLDLAPMAGLVNCKPAAASESDILRVHDPLYFRAVSRTEGRAHVQLDPDTATSQRSFEAALASAGAVVDGCRAVLGKEAQGAFILGRPPGHHAEKTSAMGFCLFNNAAVAAAWAKEEVGLSRILILDPDVHHGNGTQHSFYRDPNVLYVSSHRFPFFPGSGWFDEIGEEKGAGFTVNLPLPPGQEDDDFLYLYQEVVDPIVQNFEPELILVSAGFDIWHRDPLGGMGMQAAGFRRLFALFRSWADRFCPGRLVCTLEGGYDPAGNQAGVRAALEVMTAKEAEALEPEPPAGARAREVASRARQCLAPFWPSL